MPERKHRQVALIILDGWGYSENKANNAVWEAPTPFFDYLWQTYSPTLLEASGESVGLPPGQIGNSEICHMTIGAGRVIDTDLVRISKAISTGEFENNPVLKQLFDHVKKNNSQLQIMGLLGPGGVHSHSDHLYALLKAAKKVGIEKIFLHLFLDGRDTPPNSAIIFMKQLEQFLADLGVGLVSTMGGRYYGMDRDNNWDRLALAEAAIFESQGELTTVQPSIAIQKQYDNNNFDEHIKPIVFQDASSQTHPIQDNDGIFFFNFRADRARMISRKIMEQAKKRNWLYATMTEYDQTLKCLVAFPPIALETTLAKEISQAGLTQVHIAETEKFAHATYFLNGGREKPYPKEEHVLIESRKDVKTHDEAPEMKAKEIADEALEYIDRGTNFIFINFANPDMIGHTANQRALIKALSFVDEQLKRVVEHLAAKGGVTFVTADHGNAEIYIDSVTGEKHTAHTANLVPAIVTDKNIEILQGTLADVAPTTLTLMGLPIPSAMTGKNLAEENLIMASE